MGRTREMTWKVGIIKTMRIIRKHLWPYDASLASYVHKECYKYADSAHMY